MLRAVRFALVLGFTVLCVSLASLFLNGRAQANPGVTTLSCTPPATDSSVAGLARALNYDPILIYEYVYYNIEFEPTFGSAKGALGTLYAKRGNNIDQNVLFVTLLRQSCITANYRYGSVGLSATAVANLFGVQNDAALLADILGKGGIPACVMLSSGGTCVTSGGVADNVTLTMVWTEVTIGGTTYQLDPSLKSFNHHAPIDVALAMGYNQSALMASATSGSSTVSGMPAGVNSIKGLSQANLKTQLNTYSQNLATYIGANAPTSSTKQLFGGRDITDGNYGLTLPMGGTLYTDLPTSLEIVFTYWLSNTADGTSPISQNAIIYGSQLAGRSLTVRYANNVPSLYVNGALITSGTAGTAGGQQTLNVTVTFPYAQATSYTVHPRIGVGGTYAIILAAGEIGRDQVTELQRSLGRGIKALSAAGIADQSPLIPYGLDIIGHSYLTQINEGTRLIGNFTGTVPAFHAFMGIAGYTGSAAFVDFPGQIGSVGAATTSITQNDLNGVVQAIGNFDSSLESTTVSQMQKNEAISTVRMFDYANQDGTGFIQVTPANWAGVKPLLTNWSAADLTSMGSYLTANPGSQIILPQNGKRTVGTWAGSGYFQYLNNNGYMSLAYLISGGFKGGFGTGAYNYTVPSLADILATADMYLGIPKSLEPIDLLNGNYLYDHEDIKVGSAGFPYGLALKRSYNSRDVNVASPLGWGWRHNFMLSAVVDSDSFEGFGRLNPLAAVPTVVAFYTIKDLNTAPAPVLSNVVVGSLSASWLMDQLVNNTITVTLDEGTKKFTKIPTAAGGATYVPPPGDASVATLNADKTITMTDKAGVVTKFDADGFVTSWTDTNANIVSFTYTGTGSAKLLSKVANNMGRSLTFTYSGKNLASVSDGTRSIAYTYTPNGPRAGDGLIQAATLATFKDTKAAITNFVYDGPQSNLLTQIKYPAFSTIPSMTNVYDAWGHVLTQADAFGNVWTYMFAEGARSQEVNPEGGSHTLYFDANGNQTRDIDQAGDETKAEFDGIGRLIKSTRPSGETIALTYDAKSNVLSKTVTPIPGAIDVITGAPAAPIAESWTYTALSKPATHTDALGSVTSYAYDTAGNPTGITQPAVTKPGVTGTVAPVTTMTYGSHGLPATVTDADGRVTAFTYAATTFDLIKTVQDAGTGRLNLTTSATYDTVGNKVTATDAKGYVVTYAYDAARLVTQITPGAPFAANVTKFTYDANYNKLSVAEATGVTATPWRTTTTTYNAANKPVTVTNPDGTTSTTGYDTIQRVASVTSSSGRQVSYSYDLASRVTATVDGVSGTLDASITKNLGSVTRETRTYYFGTGGLLATITDGNGNTTGYAYDGFERGLKTVYPGGSFELHGLDDNGNELAVQRRDGSLIWFNYDALNRLVSKAPAGQPTISYGYDYTGHMLTAQAAGDASPTQIGYDTAGRKIGETTPLFGAITATLDANGNATSLTYPGGYLVSTGVDQLNRLTGIYEGSAATGVRFAGYSYDTLSQRSATSFGPAAAPVASNALGYTSAGQLASLAHTWNGSNLTLGHTYNKDHQRAGLTASDATFLPQGLAAASTTYTRNALNQYTALAGTGAATYVYDLKGNLTDDGTWIYGYDTENRLVSASTTGTSASYAYDALGRRQSKTVNGVTTSWASYGSQEIAEYQGTGALTLVGRTIFGPGLDEPVATVSATNVRTYQFQDALGSVIALANASGQVTEKYAYTAYGLNTIVGPGTAAFRYAGRRFDPETGLYFNRARAYSPTLGRFLQADPIGTQGGINLYAYTGNDPANGTDPSGNCELNSVYGSGYGMQQLGADSSSGSGAAKLGAAALGGTAAVGLTEALGGGGSAAGSGLGGRILAGAGATTGALATGILLATTVSTSKEEVTLYKAPSYSVSAAEALLQTQVGFNPIKYSGNGPYFTLDKEVARTFQQQYMNGLQTFHMPSAMYSELLGTGVIQTDLDLPGGQSIHVPASGLPVFNRAIRFGTPNTYAPQGSEGWW